MKMTDKDAGQGNGGMSLQPFKCNMMQLTMKLTKTISTLEGTILQNVDKIRYFGVKLRQDLRWKYMC